MSEAQEQIAVAAWCRAKGVPMYHVPNEQKRDPRQGAYLKRMGMCAGVPDICVPIARHGLHGLYIELKVGRNKPSKAQAEWIEMLRNEGYGAFVCYGADNAIECIEEYLNG